MMATANNGHAAFTSARKLRQVVARQSQWLASDVEPALQQLLHNDGVTQAAIQQLIADAQAFTSKTFWQRVRWLVRGT